MPRSCLLTSIVKRSPNAQSRSQIMAEKVLVKIIIMPVYPLSPTQSTSQNVFYRARQQMYNKLFVIVCSWYFAVVMSNKLSCLVLTAASKKDKSKKKNATPNQSNSQNMKREREQESEQGAQSSSSLTAEGTTSGTSLAAGTSVQPPAKKHKSEYSLNTITEEEVRRYLKRRPITSNDLVKKFTSKKTEMDKKKVVEVLHQLIQAMKNVEKQTIKGKLYLSLKTSQEDAV